MPLDSAGILGQAMTFRHDSAGLRRGHRDFPRCENGTMAGHSESPPARSRIATSCVWGIPLANLTLAETVAAISDLIEARRPSYFITANTHYAMLTEQHPDLPAINAGAALILADGAPLVWASRRTGSPLKRARCRLGLDLRAQRRSRPEGISPVPPGRCRWGRRGSVPAASRPVPRAPGRRHRVPALPRADAGRRDWR